MPLEKLHPGPALNAAAVTPHNTTELSVYARGLYVGGAGNVKLTTSEGSVVTFTAVPAGTILPCSAKLVWSTGTTATSIVALY